MIKVGIIGGAGYTAGELLRILINHSEVEIAFVHSQSSAGKPLADIHEGLIGETELEFSDKYDLNGIDCLFLCSGHGASSRFWQENLRPEGLKVIDLAQDFRDESEGYVYGLPEINRKRIAGANLIANPGCFATAIQIALLPLATPGELTGPIHVTGITGSTGAGVKPGPTTHFSWRNSNMSVYKAFTHQHLAEISRSIKQLMPTFDSEINFIPMRGDFARGIFVTAYIDTDLTLEQAQQIFRDFYADSTFVHFSDKSVDLKQVVNTNKGVVSIEKHGNKLLIISAIDNLLKGASGQAVENMNIAFGLDPSTGLRLKSSAF
ncbi:MAG: N-acetyl-gamma-glutamyl-phosphate reductase [Bacteroides sp.]|nr:N-acetyl-gamma-glutamyl-phosphate reductase [Bacteroides sp.]MCM1413166.1 N-acetyl-gamma-glutamyl-phosphate reductase [Bacteroides sp.]MCM1472092.1 N-acetyl-gamma-glutamyl-phosphate reductase [Bacteroides sp.]